jgi:hypothetical protein
VGEVRVPAFRRCRPGNWAIEESFDCAFIWVARTAFAEDPAVELDLGQACLRSALS